jgi:hypothetical protein
MAVGERALVGVVAARGCDLGQVGYETAMLVQRVADALEPGARNLSGRDPSVRDPGAP